MSPLSSHFTAFHILSFPLLSYPFLSIPTSLCLLSTMFSTFIFVHLSSSSCSPLPSSFILVYFFPSLLLMSFISISYLSFISFFSSLSFLLLFFTNISLSISLFFSPFTLLFFFSFIFLVYNSSVLCDVFFLGDFNIFESLKILEQERTEFLEDEQDPNSSLRSPMSNIAHLSVCQSLTSQIVQRMPSEVPGLIHIAAVSTHRRSTSTSTSTSTSRSNPSLGSQAAYLSLSCLSDISVELHCNKPLCEVITTSSLTQYNDILQFLLLLATTRWAADNAWMQCMRSNLFSAGKIGRGREAREKQKKKRIDGLGTNEDEMKNGTQCRAICRAGMSMMMHTLSVLQSHYMGLIHGHIVPSYCSTSSSSSSSSSSSADAPSQFDISISVLQLRGQHDSMLEEIQSILSPSRQEVISFLHSAYRAVSQIRKLLRQERNNSVQEMTRTRKQSKSSGRKGVEICSSPPHIEGIDSDANATADTDLQSSLLEKEVTAAAEEFEFMRVSVYKVTASLSEVSD